MRTIICIQAFLLLFAVQAQPRKTDSLRHVWEDGSRADTVRMMAFYSMIWNGYLFSDPDSARILGDSLYRYAMEKGCKANAGDACSILGIRCMVLGDFDGALVQLAKARKLYEEVHSASGAASVINNMGNAYWKKGDLSRAIEMYTAALQIGEKLGDHKGMAACELNIGLVYDDLRDTLRAMQHFQTALKLATDVHDEEHIGEASINLSSKAQQRGDTIASLSYLEKARVAFEHTGNAIYLSQTFNSKGLLYADMHRFEEARDALNKSLEITERMGPQVGIAPRITMVELLKDEGKYDQAIAKGEALRPLVDSSGTLNQAKNIYRVLAEVYKTVGRPALALERFLRYQTLQDSLLNDQNRSVMLRQEYKYNYDKKSLSDSLSFASEKAVQVKEIQKQKLMRNGFMGGFALVALFAGVFFFQRNRISKARKRSDELLLNILPEEVAEELKAKGEADAKQIDLVTVLFTDFKGFTAMSEQLSPKDLVRDIHECFSAFDHIMEKHGIEKIKTIGDAYMAAGGLPTPNSTHAMDVVKAALEIRDFIAEGKALKLAKGLPYFEIRIGVHTGPVVAGIVGVKKFAYDIWGDTVNTASRMESSGEVGQVNISEATYALVKDEPGLHFTPRGKVQAKGKGEMEMYFVDEPVAVLV